jgi:hypothetical protein
MPVLIEYLANVYTPGKNMTPSLFTWWRIRAVYLSCHWAYGMDILSEDQKHVEEVS